MLKRGKDIRSFMLLFIVVYLYLAFFFISLIPKKRREYKIIDNESEEKYSRMKRCMETIQKGFRRVLKLCRIKLTVLHPEQLDLGEPILYVANHRGFLDIISVFSLLIHPTGFLSKKELKKIPLLRDWMDLSGSVFVNREEPKYALEAVHAASQHMKDGLSIWVFPEGTRSTDPDELHLAEFKAGSLKIAFKNSCPIVPVAISHSDRVWERQFPRLISKQHLIIKFGEPIQTKTMTPQERKELPALLQNEVKNLLMDIQQIRRDLQEEI
ncbi:1-acyl-sn-glycerol-3-phosphate acyltransferase [Clostridia bacterium]|nr:1-acyl-sn-glycerol-3-phosphate acyltransferase [Clostridia bacterium]